MNEPQISGQISGVPTSVIPPAAPAIGSGSGPGPESKAGLGLGVPTSTTAGFGDALTAALDVMAFSHDIDPTAEATGITSTIGPISKSTSNYQSKGLPMTITESSMSSATTVIEMGINKTHHTNDTKYRPEISSVHKRSQNQLRIRLYYYFLFFFIFIYLNVLCASFLFCPGLDIGATEIEFSFMNLQQYHVSYIVDLLFLYVDTLGYRIYDTMYRIVC